MQIGKNNI